jgi:thiol-disulfide isomerase/thioredoxin
MPSTDWKKYALAFVITAALFSTAFYASNMLNAKRIEEIRSIEDRIAIDILSLETQFDLLQELSCKDITENPVLSSELNSLASRLDFAEGELGSDNAEVLRLKRQYSLLEIKDYLLMQKVSEKCELKPVFILYFYSNAGDCPDCVREGHVLTYLREQYPQLRVYSFDYNLDLAALNTLEGISKLNGSLPALVIKNKVHYGFQGTEDIEKILPELKTLKLEKMATSTDSS